MSILSWKLDTSFVYAIISHWPEELTSHGERDRFEELISHGERDRFEELTSHEERDRFEELTSHGEQDRFEELTSQKRMRPFWRIDLKRRMRLFWRIDLKRRTRPFWRIDLTRRTRPFWRIDLTRRTRPFCCRSEFHATRNHQSEIDKTSFEVELNTKVVSWTVAKKRCNQRMVTREKMFKVEQGRQVGFNIASRCFLRCRHVGNSLERWLRRYRLERWLRRYSSEQWLRRYRLSAVIMHSFSVRHKGRDFDLLEYAGDLLLIDNVMVKSVLAVFKSQMCFESSVAFAYWSYVLCLNSSLHGNPIVRRRKKSCSHVLCGQSSFHGDSVVSQ